LQAVLMDNQFTAISLAIKTWARPEQRIHGHVSGQILWT